ncbi:MAG: DUF503 domain-containing protein [bacterium]
MAAIGLLTVDLQIYDSGSLKSKRKVVKSIVTRLRNRFNVSVAEVDFQDKWQRCRLGVCVVSGEGRLADKHLRQALDAIEGMGLAVVLGFDIEIL